VSDRENDALVLSDEMALMLACLIELPMSRKEATASTLCALSESALMEAERERARENDALVLSQDDVGTDSISVEEQVASSARFAPEGAREQSSQSTPRSGRKPT
jgi:hypothetical protein